MVAANRQIFVPETVQKKDFDGPTKPTKVLSATAQKRLELAKFLGRSGRGVNCRIDIQILTLEDIKQAAYELDMLSKSLYKIAQNTDQNDVLQVLSARYEFTKTKLHIKIFRANHKEN